MTSLLSDTQDLAILGGRPVIEAPFAAYNSIGSETRSTVQSLLETGLLSGFLGTAGSAFLGGPLVREFEAAWADRFGINHAVAVNSATSGLMAAVGAAGVGPGDEVIVPPLTMSATAMAPIVYGGIPVFADVESEYFCLDLASVRAAITPRTRAIICVNLFGHPAQLTALRQIADQRGIVLIEDNSQSPLAKEHASYAGTVGHIGIFSLNVHKHIQTGEGGMCVTMDPTLASRLQLIRNHGENAVEVSSSDLTNMVGFNLRMTELTAAVGLAQLKHIDEHVAKRVAPAQELSTALGDLPGFLVPHVRSDCTHVYYCWVVRYLSEVVGITRARFSEALAAEGVPHSVGYVKPLYLLPIFQKRIAIGSKGYPFNLGHPDYSPGLCPTAERLHSEEILLIEICAHDLGGGGVDLVARAVRKVHAGRGKLADKG